MLTSSVSAESLSQNHRYNQQIPAQPPDQETLLGERQILLVSRNDEPSFKQSKFKSFLNRHSNVIGFLCSSIVISLCFIILLPRVHDSFQVQANETIDTEQTADSIGDQHHHHEHKFPTGEVLICMGFFVFYCVGLKLTDSSQSDTYELSRRRSISTAACCSSTRCPSSLTRNYSAPNMTMGSVFRENTEDATAKVSSINPDGLEDDRFPENVDQQLECLMLLNKHHQHHTHSKHHEHYRSAPEQANSMLVAGQRVTFTGDSKALLVPQSSSVNKRSDYGTTVSALSSNNSGEGDRAHQVDSKNINITQGRTIVVDEIRISSPPRRPAIIVYPWPRSLKMLVVSLIMIAIIVLLDYNALGLLRTLKVFRAASTGALLYIAFFVMLPSQSAGCNSCQAEET